MAAVRECARVPRVHVGASRARSCCSWAARSASPGSGITTGAVAWDLLQYDYHGKLQTLVRELNRLYRAEPALYEVDFHYIGFRVGGFPRRGRFGDRVSAARRRIGRDFVLFCCNFTPVSARRGIGFGVPEEGFYEEIFNSDSEMFGGSNMGNGGLVSSVPAETARPAA